MILKTEKKTPVRVCCGDRTWLKGCFVLVVLLGLTWLFGLFYIDVRSLFMAYVFTLLNSLQGLFIFIFHCLMSDKVSPGNTVAARGFFFPPGAKVRGAALATVNTHPPCTERIINKYKLTLTHCNANAKSPNFRPSNADSCKVPPEAAALSRCNCDYFLC